MEPGALALQQLVPRRLLEGVYQLTSGWEKRYLVRTAEGNVLVDTPPGEEEIFRAIDLLGGARLLFITHRDTVGDAWLFHERLGVRIAIHPDDAAYVAGAPVAIPLRDGQRLTPETQVIHAPGHSPGSCALLLERQAGALFTGDIVITDADGTVRLPLEDYSERPRRARDAAARLLRHPFDALLPAHGEPVLTGAHQRLREFVAQQ